jgi:hypothetical protein
METYRNVEITYGEAESFTVKRDGQDFTIKNEGGLVFRASSKFGDSYGKTAQQVVTDARKIIDVALGGN